MDERQAGIPVSVMLFAEWDKNVAAKKIKLHRDQQDHYTLVKRQYDADNGAPTSPVRIPIDRKGAEEMAKGLEAANAGLQKQIDLNKQAIENLRGAVVKSMDDLDVEAKKAGDD